MKERLLEVLGCPDCRGDLAMTVSQQRDSEIIEGSLRCTKCSRTFHIERGIPRMLPAGLSAEKEKTARAFGYEWRHFVEMHDVYEKQFLDWIYPLQPDFFKDKLVLDAGCGIGRHTYFAAQYGARDVVAMDLSEAVETCFANAGHLPNVHVVQADIYHPPFRQINGEEPFDFVYSIGVLHHLPDPEAGFRSLAAIVKPGGAIFGWVYGFENNGFVHYVVNPARKGVTSRLPPGIVNAMSWPITVVLQGVVKGVYRPLHGTAAGNRLPLHEYLWSLSFFSFRQNHSIVFDHLIAPTAFYLKKSEFEGWFQRAGLEHIQLSWRNQNSWRGFGQVPAAQEVRRVRTS